MTIEDKNVVDFIGIDKENGEVGLLISDHLPWDQKKPTILKDKVNAYLHYIETGELKKALPEAEGRKVYIELVYHIPPNEISERILAKIKDIAGQIDVGFTWSEYIEDPLAMQELPGQDPLD